MRTPTRRGHRAKTAGPPHRPDAGDGGAVAAARAGPEQPPGPPPGAVAAARAEPEPEQPGTGPHEPKQPMRRAPTSPPGPPSCVDVRRAAALAAHGARGRAAEAEEMLEGVPALALADAPALALADAAAEQQQDDPVPELEGAGDAAAAARGDGGGPRGPGVWRNSPLPPELARVEEERRLQEAVADIGRQADASAVRRPGVPMPLQRRQLHARARKGAEGDDAAEAAVGRAAQAAAEAAQEGFAADIAARETLEDEVWRRHEEAEEAFDEEVAGAGSLSQSEETSPRARVGDEGLAPDPAAAVRGVVGPTLSDGAEVASQTSEAALERLEAQHQAELNPPGPRSIHGSIPIWLRSDLDPTPIRFPRDPT